MKLKHRIRILEAMGYTLDNVVPETDTITIRKSRYIVIQICKSNVRLFIHGSVNLETIDMKSLTVELVSIEHNLRPHDINDWI